MSRDIAPFGVRMPAELKETVERAAKENGRSMNAEIILRLEDSFIGGSSDSRELLSAEDARRVLEKARLEVARSVRQHVIDAVNETINQGKDEVYLDFDSYMKLDGPEDSRIKTAILPALGELVDAGYSVEEDEYGLYTIKI